MKYTNFAPTGVKIGVATKNRMILISLQPLRRYSFRGFCFSHSFTRPFVTNYTNPRFLNIMKLIAEEGED